VIAILTGFNEALLIGSSLYLLAILFARRVTGKPAAKAAGSSIEKPAIA